MDEHARTEQAALITIISAFRRQSKLFLVIFALVVVCAILYAFLSRPVYRAELVMAPVSTESSSGILSSIGSQFGQLASLAGFQVGQDSELQTNLALLTSKKFTEKFIADNNVVPVLYRDDWDASTNTWQSGKEVSTWEVIDRFSSKICSIRFDPSSKIVRVRMDWYDRELAADWANKIGEQLNREIRNRVIREAGDSIDFLRAELDKTSIVGVEQSIYRLIEAQVAKIMMANVRKDYAFQIIDPAIAPDVDAQVRPNRPLVLVAGILLGFILGGFAVLIKELCRHVA